MGGHVDMITRTGTVVSNSLSAAGGCIDVRLPCTLAKHKKNVLMVD